MEPTTVGLDAFPFHIHWDVLGVIVALAGGYIYSLVRLAPDHAPASEPAFTRRQVASFTLGLVLFWLVRTWPIHDIGEGSLFTFHMIEHLTLALAVPPLLLKGTPWWLMRMLVLPIMSVVKFLTKPLIALVLFNVTLAALHVPAVIELMLDSEPAHLLLHLLLVVTAILMWWPVIGPIPDIPKLPPLYAMGYLFLQSLVPTVPASFLTFADGVVYKAYEDLPRLWGLDVRTDQLIAGLIMKIGGGFFLWAIITYIFFSWAAEEERANRPPEVRVR
ncbi:cytochrome c oxidase assembly protein [bacterium]|nr:cytochrome c oxidase assembly protein [bacterium]